MSRLAVYGASGHGKVVADIAHRNGYKEIIFIDDGDNEHMDFETFSKNFTTILHVALGVGDNKTRAKVYNKVIEAGYDVITLIDPSAIIAPSVKVEKAVVIMPGVIINADAQIKTAAILNSGSVIEHDCHIGTFSHISPNVSLAGGVDVGTFSHIGIGSSVVQNIKIGENTVVGAGTIVINDIQDNVVVVGNPGSVIKENHEK